MPNKATFTIPPIKELVLRYVGDGKGWADPFAGNNSPAEFTNDLNPNTSATSHVTALDFSKSLNMELNGALFDPPYSGRQVKECYAEINIIPHTDDTNAYFYWSVKDTLSPLIRIGGYAISCGWNTSGFGKKNGFEIVEILLVSHGGAHNDTIVTVDRKSRLLSASLSQEEGQTNHSIHEERQEC